MSKFGASCLPGPGNLFTWPRVLSLPTPGNLFAQRVQQLVVVAAAPMILADSRPDDQPFSLHQFAQRLFYRRPGKARLDDQRSNRWPAMMSLIVGITLQQKVDCFCRRGQRGVPCVLFRHLFSLLSSTRTFETRRLHREVAAFQTIFQLIKVYRANCKNAN